ncbi:MAG: replication initiator protein [Microvirus sp.]|nr:MAG: replication initiator protein [Microvirus sp.]
MKCKSPIFVKTAGGLVPCGQCLPCRFNKRRKWTFRLLLEFLSSQEGCWITLTYSDEHEPKIYKEGEKVYHDNSGQSLGCLNPDDVRRFIMRLRTSLGDRKIRYFMCGEYGETTHRPHYHVCLFGIGSHWQDLIRKAWCDPYKNTPLGHVDIGTLTVESMQYTCGYVVKKLTKKDDERLFGLYPEFVRFSQGIGKHSIDKIADALRCKTADLYYMTKDDIPRSFNACGKAWPMDRYIRDKVLELIGKFDDAKEKGKERYQKEVQRMSVAAQTRLSNMGSSPSQAALLEFQYQAENAQSVLNAEKRALLFMSRKEKAL